MIIGDVINSAIWVTGDESAKMRADYEGQVSDAINYFCHEQGMIHGPVTFIEKRPEEDGVPEVPDHIQGQRVRLLVGEATVVAKAAANKKGSFVGNLDVKDLARLRGIIRRSHHKHMNGGQISNDECDEIIEELGPETALDTLRSLH